MSTKKTESLLYPFLTVFLTTLIFAFSFGFLRVLPEFTEWLFFNDPGTHYLGWAYFRNDPWSFPLGFIPSYGYPAGTNISLTDSIPLMAIPFKLLRSFLPENFQYIGLYTYLNFVLQGLVSYFIARRLKSTPLQGVLFSLIIVLTPSFLFRTPIHVALSTHWPLLLGLSFAGDKSKKMKWAWYLLVAMLALIHPYLWAMFMLISFFHEWLKADQVFNKIVWLNLLSYVVISLFIWLIVGTLGNSEPISPGIGGFSARLSALIDPSGFSTLFKNFKIHTNGTPEALGYLGLGGLLIVLVTSILFLNESIRSKTITALARKKIAFLILVFWLAGSFVFAWGDWVILDLFKPMKLLGAVQILSIFRTTGRFIWIALYATALWSLAYLIKREFKLLTPLLLIALALQFLDQQDLLKTIQYHPESVQQTHWMNDSHWKQICANKKHIYFYPNEYDIARLRYAYECGTTVNTAYSARAPKNREALLGALFNEMTLGKVDPDAVFILKNNVPSELKEKLKTISSLQMEEYDGQLILTHRNL